MDVKNLDEVPAFITKDDCKDTVLTEM